MKPQVHPIHFTVTPPKLEEAQDEKREVIFARTFNGMVTE
jgi:hypothetical protein